jgi:hypothetical protein
LEPYFLEGIDHPHHFKNAIEFIKISPRQISLNTLINLKKQFEKYYKYYLGEMNPEYVLNNDSLVSPYETDEHISLLREIGEFFDFDISEGISKLEEIKIKVEEYMAESIDDDFAYESRRDDKAIQDSEEEINRIFCHLDNT